MARKGYKAITTYIPNKVYAAFEKSLLRRNKVQDGWKDVTKTDVVIEGLIGHTETWK